jgi:NAD(P)-dependent dehydrogenase (short-subunit alcohol dehydrogenase family)
MGRKVLIVGGSGGLGRKVSEQLRNKYDVTSIGSKDLDIRKLEVCLAYFKNNQFDVVVNFAGTNYDSFIHKIDESDEIHIKNMIDVNLHGSINLISSALKPMRANGYGRIILISSVLSEKTVVGTGIYSSCKSFIDRFVKNVSAENVKYGITANSLQLGYFDGGMTYRIPEDLLENIKSSIGLKRFGRIEEITSTIEFLIETEYVTGANIKIDGNT